MRILLDECVPFPIRRILLAHECRTAQQCGWGGLKNGELLRRAEQEFDLFVTCDQNLQFQQNIHGRRIRILQLSTNKLRPIMSAAALIQATIDGMGPGAFVALKV